MQSPEPFPPADVPQPPARRRLLGGSAAVRPGEGFWLIGERLARVAGLVLALSAFMSWYSGSDDGPTIAVIGWHVGILGKLIFVLAALIAFSRVYVGVHYPFDVLAGAVLGLAVATALPRLLVVLRRSRRPQPEG